MTYLFTNNQEIKNDVGNPIPISKNTSINNAANPIHTTGTLTGTVSVLPAGASSTSAFGEPLAVPITPIVQLEAIYGLDPDKFQTYTAFSGSVDSDGPMMECSTGTAQYGYGVIRSKRSVRYRPGQGAVARFTAAFTTNELGDGYAGYTQRAGFFSQESALQIGFDGTRFGVLRQDGGKATIYNLKINTAATTNATVTLTLNGAVYNIPITAGTVAHNAQEIGAFNFGPGWLVNSVEDEVVFLSTSVGVMGGTFSVTDNSVNFDSTLTRLQQGVAHIEYWTYQEDFNEDRLDGTGPSGVIVDPSKLNVYQINFRWLGAGEIRFAIEDPNNGNMIFFHHIHYSNKYTVPHISNPSLKIGYISASLGGTGTNVVVKGSSLMGAIEGVLTATTFPDSAAAIRSSGLNTGGTQYHMLSVQNRLVLNSKINTKELVLQSMSAGATSAASTPIRFIIYRNLSVTNTFEWLYENKAWSAGTYSIAETTVANNGRPIFQIMVSPGAAQMIELTPYRITVTPGDSISVVVVGSGVISHADVILNWIED